MTITASDQLEGLGTYKFGWADPDVAGASARRGLSEEVVRDISARKGEPEWMLQMRPGVNAADAAKGSEVLRPKAVADLGQRPKRDRLRQHQVLRPVDREAGR